MTKNVGNTERVIRAIVGLGLLSLIVILEGNARWWGLIGLVPLLTAAFGYCPPYAMLGINTCAKK
ncbi:MAG: YgaP family membrane protein [Burkholderiales bacterium]